ncbi:hypothetical protein DXG01_009042 [Tephrocybe rancida]|nr:hypothetical protein DXG01_009042 [Tephrocybe rancida]
MGGIFVNWRARQPMSDLTPFDPPLGPNLLFIQNNSTGVWGLAPQPSAFDGHESALDYVVSIAKRLATPPRAPGRELQVSLNSRQQTSTTRTRSSSTIEQEQERLEMRGTIHNHDQMHVQHFMRIDWAITAIYFLGGTIIAIIVVILFILFVGIGLYIRSQHASTSTRSETSLADLRMLILEQGKDMRSVLDPLLLRLSALVSVDTRKQTTATQEAGSSCDIPAGSSSAEKAVLVGGTNTGGGESRETREAGTGVNEDISGSDGDVKPARHSCMPIASEHEGHDDQDSEDDGDWDDDEDGPATTTPTATHLASLPRAYLAHLMRLANNQPLAHLWVERMLALRRDNTPPPSPPRRPPPPGGVYVAPPLRNRPN